MNKSALKNFATDARRELIKKVAIKAHQLGVTEEKIKRANIESSDAIFVDGRPLSIEEKTQRDKLIDEIEVKGYNQVIEEVAYTWFNRFTAIRFMEVNDYLPHRVRVLSSTNEGSYEPDIVKEALNVGWDIDKELVYKLRTSKDNDAIDRLYKYLILKQCDELSKILPFMFENTDDYTKLLFPEGLLFEGSFLRKLTDLDNIPEDDWKEVEIIGWLYQYYIAEENERVIQAKKRYKKEEIPFATQLFTPDWIVNYMVQNALGRYWVESHTEDRELIETWEYYLENPDQESDFEEKLGPYINRDMRVEDIKCFDPAMGSGHILVYMFDVLYQIYSRCGYMEREIPKHIIENNLYGLEIDDRAYQLACFAVLMKAQQYNPRFLRSLEGQVRNTGEYIKLNLASIQETNHITAEDIAYLAGEDHGEEYDKVKAFIDQFRDAKIYGSLTEIKEFDEDLLTDRIKEVMKNPVELYHQESRNRVIDLVPDLIKQTKIMSQTYDVLVTNPPYMGSSYLNISLRNLLNEKYSDVKSDIFSAFMVYGFNKTKKNGHLGFMTPFVWMFISSYEKLRKTIIDHKNISSLVQLEYSGFDGATVPICTFTLRNINNDLSGEYIRLSDFRGSENQPIKVKEAVLNPDVEYRYTAKTDNFNKIPGQPIAYWLSNPDIFNGQKLGDYYFSGGRNKTHANEKYVRYIWEVDVNKTYWKPYANGGEYKKYYGNEIYLVDWSTTARDFYSSRGGLLNSKFYNKEGICWSLITSAYSGFRLKRLDAIYSSASPTIFNNEYKVDYYSLAYLNSKVVQYLLKILNPTLNTTVNDVLNLPLNRSKGNNTVEKISKMNLAISRTDWDSFETSWDFKVHPFLKHVSIGVDYKLSDIFSRWQDETEEAFNQLKANEEEINRIFIDIYGLQNELTPEVEDKDITISKAHRERDVKSFISYAVGCMLGRYSLDEEGLAYAGGEFNPSKYKTFPAHGDNIIPILSDSYFEDDIVDRFIDFVRIVFGEEYLDKNLHYIADTLGIRNNEIPRDTIRRYFLNDFYKDHVKIYKKRPIYWLFTSGRQKAFNALIYMHRYDKYTLARIRTDYLHVLQSKLETERQSLEANIAESDNTREKRQYQKRLDDIDKEIEELKAYDEVLHNMADEMIEIDLDDGVKVNYEKFKGLVQRI